MVALAFQQLGDVRGDEGPVGVEGVGDGLAGQVVENLGEVRPQHGFPAGDGPAARPQGAGLIDDVFDFIESEFFFLFSGFRRAATTSNGGSGCCSGRSGQYDPSSGRRGISLTFLSFEYWEKLFSKMSILGYNNNCNKLICQEK